MKKKLLLLFGVIILLTGCFNNKTVEDEPNTESLKENIKTTVEKFDNKELIFLKNNNSKAVSINIDMSYLNNEDVIISSDAKNILSVGEKNEIVLKIDNVPSEYKESKISYDVTIPSYIKDYTDNVEIEHKRGNKVIASVKNTSDVTINNLSLSVVFYNDSKIVGYDEEIILDLKSNEKGKLEFFNPMDTEHNYIKYDDYKIYINYAYSFDYENKS